MGLATVALVDGRLVVAHPSPGLLGRRARAIALGLMEGMSPPIMMLSGTRRLRFLPQWGGAPMHHLFPERRMWRDPRSRRRRRRPPVGLW